MMGMVFVQAAITPLPLLILGDAFEQVQPAEIGHSVGVT